MDSADAELAVYRSGDKYNVTWTWQGRKVSGAFALPADLALDALSGLALQGPEGQARSGDIARSIGARLFDTVLSSAFRDALNEARSAAGEIRVWLRFDDDPQLHELPWELLYDASSGEFLALSGVSFVRAVDRPALQQRPGSGSPLRILFVTASPTDHASIERVSREVSEAVGSRPGGAVVVSNLAHASVSTFREALTRIRPEIVHLDVHSAHSSDGTTGLIFEDEDSRSTAVSPTSLISLLADSWFPTLVLVMASSTRDLGLTLVRAGVQAVIATQFELTELAAQQFSVLFYEELLAGLAIDAAITGVRRRLFAEGSSADRLAWAIPVLYANEAANLYRVVSAPVSDADSRVLPPREAGTLGGADNDSVGTEDRLGFQPYVDAFADLIASPYTKPPLTIGIFGSWGMGKSFLLQHIQQEVSRRSDGDRGSALTVHAVPFNAWAFSETEVVWPGLVRKIIEKLDQDVPYPRHKRWWTRLKWNLPRELRRLSTPLIAGALVTATAIGVSLWQHRTNLAAALIGAVGLLSIGGLVKAASNPVARWVTALFAESDYGRQIGYMEDIKHDLETLEARLHIGGDADGPVEARILVLVDDLDRCEPNKAVEMLQAVNLLLNFNSFIVCLGIDARIVTSAIERHYEGLLGEAGASGYEYLDKIVQIPFRIPEPSPDEVKIFIASQLGNPAAPEITESHSASGAAIPTSTEAATGSARTQTTEPDTASTVTPADVPAEATTNGSLRTESQASVPFTYTELQAFQAITPFLRPNPRHLKRLINVYRLVRSLAYSKNEQLILGNPTAAIRWLVMWSQWPYTARAMMERYDELLEQWDGTVRDNAAEENPLLYLLDGVTPQLDQETRDQFDSESDMLRELLKTSGRRFAWEQLRQIRKYTVNLNPAVEDQLHAFRLQTPDRDNG